MKRSAWLLIVVALFWISGSILAAQGYDVSLPLVLGGRAPGSPSPTVVTPTATTVVPAPTRTPTTTSSPTETRTATPTVTAIASPTATQELPDPTGTVAPTQIPVAGDPRPLRQHQNAVPVASRYDGLWL